MDGRTLFKTAATALAIGASALGVSADGGAFLTPLNTIKLIGSTVPHSGDVNPYGVAIVRDSVGKLVQGSILVSNFNDAANLQGTGMTIVQLPPGGGKPQLFASINPKNLPGDCPGGVGLTTALSVLRRGWVIVGSLPTTDGTSATARAGCLIVLDAGGRVVETFAGNGINGPWDMTARDGDDYAALFVTNVLNGDVTSGNPHVVEQGTVLRIDLAVPEQKQGLPQRLHTTTIGSGFPETADPAALVIGPTGVGLGQDGTLYVADSIDNVIAAIPNALTRSTSAGTGTGISSGGALNDPLGLAIAPNGDILTANGNDGNLVETTPAGTQVAVKTIETATGAGSLFGIAVAAGDDNARVYFVDDGDNTLKVLEGSGD